LCLNKSNNEAALYPNLDYGALGIPPAMQAINAVPGAAPEFYPGGTFSNLNQTNSLHKRERQTSYAALNHFLESPGTAPVIAGLARLRSAQDSGHDSLHPIWLYGPQ
jgi:hypothetical protein